MNEKDEKREKQRTERASVKDAEQNARKAELVEKNLEHMLEDDDDEEHEEESNQEQQGAATGARRTSERLILKRGILSPQKNANKSNTTSGTYGDEYGLSS